MAWPRSFIDEVRNSSDPVRIVGEVVTLKKRGVRFVGLCPFHQEKTPSFSVNDEGLWYCFGCGEGGDIFKFVQRHEGLDFTEAVHSLASRAGVQVPELSNLPSDAGRKRPEATRERLMEVLAVAADRYRESLMSDVGAPAREYLEHRGLTAKIIKRFGLGWAHESWDAMVKHLRARGFSDEELLFSGIARRREDGSSVYDFLRARIVFPICDLRGRPVAFGGRVLGRVEPKYLNSPETRLFTKGRTLYGMSEARDAIRKGGFVILVEGNLDLIACSQHGFTNVVAPLGTSLSEEHTRLLSRYTRKVMVAFDSDRPGLAAAERATRLLLQAGMQVSVARLPPGSDPDSFLAAEGPKAFAGALRSGSPGLDFLVHQVGSRHDLGSPQGKSQALASLLEFVGGVGDRVERAEWVGRISESLNIDRHLVEQAAAETLQSQHSRSAPTAAAGRSRSKRLESRLQEAPLAERELVRAVIENPDWLKVLTEICGAGSIRDLRVAAILEAMQQCSDEGDAAEPDAILLRCEVPGVSRLLSRILLEDLPEADWNYAKGCAEGIRRDALRQQLRDVQTAVEEAVTNGETDRIGELQRKKVELAQKIQGS